MGVAVRVGVGERNAGHAAGVVGSERDLELRFARQRVAVDACERGRVAVVVGPAGQPRRRPWLGCVAGRPTRHPVRPVLDVVGEIPALYDNHVLKPIYLAGLASTRPPVDSS
jgi:hypothetical protein